MCSQTCTAISFTYLPQPHRTASALPLHYELHPPPLFPTQIFIHALYVRDIFCLSFYSPNSKHTLNYYRHLIVVDRHTHSYTYVGFYTINRPSLWRLYNKASTQKRQYPQKLAQLKKKEKSLLKRDRSSVYTDTWHQCLKVWFDYGIIRAFKPFFWRFCMWNDSSMLAGYYFIGNEMVRCRACVKIETKLATILYNNGCEISIFLVHFARI